MSGEMADAVAPATSTAAPIVARSPLGAETAEPRLVASGPGVEVFERPFTVQIDIRIDPTAEAIEEVGEALRVALPAEPNRVSTSGALQALWLSPDEWLIVAPAGDSLAIARTARAAVEVFSGAVVDVSAHRTLLELRGPAVRDLLSRGCSLDLHPRAFPADACAQTMLARADVILFQPGAEAFGVFVRSSFANYLVAWLRDAIAGMAGTRP
jgi:sarcosine oxidase, subunit gamma